MEPGIMLYIGCKVDIYEQIRVLKEIGVRRTFINARHPEIDKVIATIKEAGLICDNLHSEYSIIYEGKNYPFEAICCPGIYGDLLRDRIMQNIDVCARNNIPVIVIHAPQSPPEVAMNQYTKKRYTEIGNYARKKGVRIAFENTKYTENLEYIMSLVSDSGFCWDCGHEHCHLVGEKPMKLFSGKVLALHVHDNCLTADNHYIPFVAKIDFDGVAREIAKSGYDGTLMLEIMYGVGEGNSTEHTYKEFALKAKMAAERIIDMVKQYQKIFGAEGTVSR